MTKKCIYESGISKAVVDSPAPPAVGWQTVAADFWAFDSMRPPWFAVPLPSPNWASIGIKPNTEKR